MVEAAAGASIVAVKEQQAARFRVQHDPGGWAAMIYKSKCLLWV